MGENKRKMISQCSIAFRYAASIHKLTICEIIEDGKIDREGTHDDDRNPDTRCDPVDERITCPRVYESSNDKKDASYTG